MGVIFYPVNLDYTGYNIMDVPEIPSDQVNYQCEYTMMLPEPGTIHLEPEKVKRDLKEVPNIANSVDDVGVQDIGFK